MAYCVEGGRKLPSSLNEALDKITADKVKMYEDEATENWRRVNSVIKELVHQMKKDPKFESMYEDHIATGSYYEKLRAMEPNEFDCAFLFKNLNVDSRTFQVDRAGAPQAFAFCKLANKADANKIACYREFITGGGYLDPTLFYRWFFGLVQSAMKKSKDELVGVVGPSENRPAVTITIDGNIDVDLMPAFKGRDWPQDATLPQGHGRMFEDMSSIKLEIERGNSFWLLGTKPYKIVDGEYCNNPHLLWRFAFSPMEKRLFRSARYGDTPELCYKQILRLLKTLKSYQQWTSIKSYYLKTLMLHAMADTSISWEREHLGENFLEMLKRLQKALEYQRLPYFWFHESNLFEKLGCQYMIEVANRIGRIIRDIKADFRNVYKYFTAIDLKALNDCLLQIHGKDDSEEKELTQGMSSLGFGHSIGIGSDEEAPKEAFVSYLVKAMEKKDLLFCEQGSGSNQFLWLNELSKSEYFEVDLCGAPPGFGYYRLKEDDEDIVQKFAKFLRGNYCLDPSRFYKWFYGLVSKSKDAAKRGITASTREGRSVVKLSISGMDDENVHPVIRGKGLPPAVDPPKKLNSVHDLLYREEAAGRLTWALQPPSRQQGNDLLWEFTFQPIEETWLGKTICRRMVHALMSRLFEIQSFTSLSPKVALMLMMQIDIPNNKGKNDVAEFFIKVLVRLEQALEKRKLSNFWIPKINEFDSLREQVMEEYAVRFGKINMDISTDHKFVYKLFKHPEY